MEDHFRSILGIINFAVSGSFAVGDDLRYCTVLLNILQLV